MDARHIETFLRAPGGGRRAPPRRTRSAVGRRARGTDPHPQRHRPGIPRAGYPAHVVRRAGGAHPQRTALLEADGGTLSYAELDAKVQAVADALRAAGVSADERVALLVARGPHLLPAILGVQRAGAYVPINPDHPWSASACCWKTAAPAWCWWTSAQRHSASLGETRVLHLERLPQSTGDLPAANVAPSDLAYVIYTSGSTGVPKGVMVEHRSVVNRLNWMQRRYPIGERDVLLQKTPVTFDVSVWELFWWSFTAPACRCCRPAPRPAGNAAKHPARRGHGHPLRAVDADAVPRPARRRPDPHGGKLAAPGVLQRRSPRAVAGRALPPAVRRRRATGQPVRTDRGHRRRVRP